MQITLTVPYEDGTTAWEITQPGDVQSVLSWALDSWHPARGPRIAGGTGFYLNDRLMVSIDGGTAMPVRDAIAQAGMARAA